MLLVYFFLISSIITEKLFYNNLCFIHLLIRCIHSDQLSVLHCFPFPFFVHHYNLISYLKHLKEVGKADLV